EKSAAELREEIDRTRVELGQTVDALAQKADVKARAKSGVQQGEEQLHLKSAELKEQLGLDADAPADLDTLKEGGRNATSMVTARARDNPVPCALGALATV